MKGAKGGSRDNQITFRLKRKNLKKQKEKDSQKQHVYRVHDFFVLPLVFGMAFYQGKDLEQKKDGTLSLDPLKKDPVSPSKAVPENPVIEIVEQQLEEILTGIEEALDPQLKTEEERMDFIVSTEQLISFVQEEVEEIRVVDQIGDYKEATKEEQKDNEFPFQKFTKEEQKDVKLPLQEFTKEEQEQIQEANTWIEENHVSEILEEAKQKCTQISIGFKDQETFQKRKQELKDFVSLVERERLQQLRTMEEIEKNVNSITNQVEKTMEEVRRNRERFVTNLFLLQAISKMKMNRFMKFFLRLSLLSSLVHSAPQREERPDLSSYVDSLSSMQATNQSLLADLDQTVARTHRFVQEFEREYGPFRAEIPEYDSMLKEIQKAEEELEKQAIKLQEQNRSLKEQSNKILEKKY